MENQKVKELLSAMLTARQDLYTHNGFVQQVLESNTEMHRPAFSINIAAYNALLGALGSHIKPDRLAIISGLNPANKESLDYVIDMIISDMGSQSTQTKQVHVPREKLLRDKLLEGLGVLLDRILVTNSSHVTTYEFQLKDPEKNFMIRFYLKGEAKPKIILSLDKFLEFRQNLNMSGIPKPIVRSALVAFTEGEPLLCENVAEMLDATFSLEAENIYPIRELEEHLRNLLTTKTKRMNTKSTMSYVSTIDESLMLGKIELEKKKIIWCNKELQEIFIPVLSAPVEKTKEIFDEIMDKEDAINIPLAIIFEELLLQFSMQKQFVRQPLPLEELKEKTGFIDCYFDGQWEAVFQTVSGRKIIVGDSIYQLYSEIRNSEEGYRIMKNVVDNYIPTRCGSVKNGKDFERFYLACLEWETQ